ncbi:ATP synthase F1 subunit gamma [Candidatus Uhrbacteria bacterium CG10_big_fil_rev_8_21_14_0_10_48_16]|uniref:ATP synthase gamma chain n=1 Tax=Candidatus Uhrbacteria bacterium CG10_big_fil_rev_8_21_14_0_10_48_16 TaxID=1975038 RepID=A0A2M8LIC0_9BACT|nr:MAG: ATP synthase F1 subunit gamma [Candidatus Uhrbacteria bacterium CG10_big_fil_rev_8_21_14_0_10_48_16]
MAVQTRTIKRRIKSVKNTRKITKAMEMVAASKMRKAVNSVIGSRPYSKLAWNTVKSIGSRVDMSLHPLLRKEETAKNVLVLLITSDKGLAGGFNTNILRRTKKIMEELGEGVNIQTICIGKRGADAMRRMNRGIMASFVDITNNTTFEEVLPIGRMVIDEFTKGNVDKVFVAYTDFVSAVSQNPLILELLPLGTEEDMEQIGEVTEVDKGKEKTYLEAKEYTFEPSPQLVLNQILPRLVETMVYQAVLESAASEHSARMMAMRSATDAAGEMLDDLTFTFNQARQAGITQEIAEISSGKAALEG